MHMYEMHGQKHEREEIQARLQLQVSTGTRGASKV